MDYRVRVYDEQTGDPIQGATLTIFDYDSSPISVFQTDSEGKHVYDSEVSPEAFAPGHIIRAEAPGYNPIPSDTDRMAAYDSYAFALTKTSKNYLPALLLLGAGAGVYAATREQKTKKVSGFDLKPYLPYVPSLVGIGLGGFLVYKVGQKFGLFDDEEDRRRKQEAAEREEQGQASMDQICRLTPSTRTNADWVAICDKIEAALDYAGWLDSYGDEVVVQLSKAQNDCDVQKLIYYFGHRELRSPFLFKGGDYTLSKGILERMSREQVDSVNADYEYKGIDARW